MFLLAALITIIADLALDGLHLTLLSSTEFATTKSIFRFAQFGLPISKHVKRASTDMELTQTEVLVCQTF